MSTTLQPSTINRLSQAQKNILEQKCRDRLNWSDSGHWIGPGKAPNCFQKERTSNTFTHTLNFPTDASATKWNLECEEVIRYYGHVGTATLTVAVALATGGLLTSIIFGAVAAIAKDEAQAKIDYPRVARGWQYELTYENTLIWSAHPWGKKSFSQKITGIARSHEKVENYRAQKNYKYNLDELPDGLARSITSARSRATVADYA